MQTLLCILASIIENITFVGIALYLTNSLEQIKSFRSIMLFIFSCIVLHIIQEYDNSYIHIGLVVGICQYVFVIKKISSKPVKDVITSVIMTYILKTLFQIPLIIPVMKIYPDFNLETSVSTSLLIVCISSLIMIPFFYFLPIRNLFEKIINIPGFIFMSVSLIFAIGGILVYFSNGVNMPHYITLLASFLFIFLAFFLTIFFAIRTHKKEQALLYYETYLPILDQMILNIRKTQHNYNNTIQSIAALPMAYTTYDALASSLSRLSTHLTDNVIPTKFLHFDNKLLSALLYNKLYISVEKNIHMEISIHNYLYNTRCNEFQIIDLTGILLDNALEACQTEDTIFVEIGTPPKKNINSSKAPQPMFSITVKNPGPEATQDFIKKIFSEQYSSKEKHSTKHGLGLPYLQSVVHRNKGQIEISNEMIPQDDNQIRRYFVICVTV